MSREGVPALDPNAMDMQTKQPKRQGRKRRIAGSAVFLFALALLLSGGLLWWWRIPLTTRVVRGILDRQGFSDVSFRLSRLESGRVTIEDFRLGTPDPMLAVGEVDVRFSLADLMRRHVERVHVQGVRTWLTVCEGKPDFPVYARLKPTLARPARQGARLAGNGAAKGSVWMASARDVRVDVMSAGHEPLASLTMEAGALAETGGLYRVWGRLQDGHALRLQAEGTVQAESGDVSVTPELTVGDLGSLVALARRLTPEQLAGLTLFPTNCSLTLQGAFAFANWTNAGAFEVSAALGRGSGFDMPSKDALVRFQSLRVEASGTPREVQCRVNAGLSGFRFGPDFEASQDSGRMLSLRGSARFCQSATHQSVTATFDSDLPGRSLARVLPRLVPLVPVFFSDGGALRAEADVTRPFQGPWGGQARFTAEASRSSAPLTAGRVGAATVRVEGVLQIEDTKPGALTTDIKVADGYFFRRDLSVRGGLDASLTATPPYASASGHFKGRMGESIALARRNLSLGENAVPFEGDVRVAGLPSNPAWAVALRVPEFGVASAQPSAQVTATAGAAASLRYDAENLAVAGEAWLRDVAMLAGPESNRLGEAGVKRITARFKVPEFKRVAVSNAVAEVRVCASNGWAKAGSLAVLEDAEVEVPLTWSAAAGLSFPSGQRLGWRRMEAQGLKIVPDGFVLARRDNVVESCIGARVSESRLGAAVTVRVPLDSPRQVEFGVSMPDTVIAADDAVAATACAKLKDAQVSGRVSAEARVRFLGTQPHVVGRLRVADGRAVCGQMEVDGLAADVPFEGGISFRTIERPFISFLTAKAGNVRLGKGTFAFQLTPQELFVDRMEVGWCKGSLNAYSLHLDLKAPRDDFVVYADRIDLGEALMMVMPFKGMMEGVLYGRIPMGFDNGRIKVSTGFLYSLPGQGGRLKLDDSRQMLSLLDKAGIRGDVQVPLSKALSDMDFNTFKMELEPGKDGDGTLRMKMAGKSNDRAWPAPVDLNLNLHAPLEELLNMGLNLSRK